MRIISLILFFILIGCKSETKPGTIEKEIDISVNEIFDTWYFHINKAIASRLGVLTLTVSKKAMSVQYTWCEEANEDLPCVDINHIITDFDVNAQTIIETVKVDKIPFHEISAAYTALEMGTTIEPLKKMKKST